MSINWAVAQQVVQDNATGLRFEFDANTNDSLSTCTLRVFTKERTRVLVLMFARDGVLIKSDVRGVRDGQLEDVGQAAFQELHQDPAVADAAARSSADLTAHTGGVVSVSTGDNLPTTAAGVPGEPRPLEPGESNAEVVDVSQDMNEAAAADARQADEAPKQQGVFYGG
jgi:hypothetical protein